MKSFETSGIFVQEMILVASFLLDSCGNPAVVYPAFQKAEGRGNGCQFSFTDCQLRNPDRSAERLSGHMGREKQSFFILQPVGL